MTQRETLPICCRTVPWQADRVCKTSKCSSPYNNGRYHTWPKRVSTAVDHGAHGWIRHESDLASAPPTPSLHPHQAAARLLWAAAQVFLTLALREYPLEKSCFLTGHNKWLQESIKRFVIWMADRRIKEHISQYYNAVCTLWAAIEKKCGF